MGCDIHLNIEHKGKHRWESFGPTFNPGRHYGMFALMAGVRNYDEIEPISEPKGMPDDISWRTMDGYTLFITERDTEEIGYCTRERAESWVKHGCSKWIDGNRVSDPDWHTPSWLSTAEYEKVIEKADKQYLYSDYQAVLAVMKEFERLGEEARIVFWFDN